MKRLRPSIARLRERLRYDASTGDMFWINGPRAGELAGSAGADGYRTVTIDGVLILAHRAAWAIYHGRWPRRCIDHKNRKRSDNRIDNLRDVHQFVNAQNVSLERRRHPFRQPQKYLPGVFRAAGGRWRAGIRAANVSYDLGVFDDEHEAHLMYLIAKHEFHKEAIAP